jgi:DNA helicase II / ATP-dependent DNA helicase PcrA
MQDLKKICEDLDNLENRLLENKYKAKSLRDYLELFFIEQLWNSVEDKNFLKFMLPVYYKKYNIDNSIREDCNKLIGKLNIWSHYKSKKLPNKELKKYFKWFRSLIYNFTWYECLLVDKNNDDTYSIENYNLDEMQEKAVLVEDKYTLVNAWPGTWKTYLIVVRILNEIFKNNNKKIYSLSFTNNAADELKERIDEKIFDTNLWIYRNNIFTWTIHSFSLNVMKDFSKYRNKKFDYVIIDEKELDEIKDIIKNKNELKEYLDNHKLLTFDNIINKFIEIISNDKKFQTFIKNYIDEIIIDEAQDLDIQQYNILKLLKTYIKDLKLFFVGDQRQNIYGFCGWSLENIEVIEKKSVFTLEYSYRCPTKILNFVNKFKFIDCENYQLKNSEGKLGNIYYSEFENMIDEANWIAWLIKTKEDSIGLNNMAILYTNCYYFEKILKALNSYEIPFKVFGGKTVLQREIKILKDILNFIYEGNEESHFLNNIQRYFINKIEWKNIEEILKYKWKKSLKHINLFHIINFIKVHKETNLRLLEIVIEFIKLIEKENIFWEESIKIYNDFRKTIEENISLDSFNVFKSSFSVSDVRFNKYYYRTDELVKSEYYNVEIGNYLTVSTIHSAKWLEWEEVIIPWMSQNSLPRYNSNPDIVEIKEELKKFYVACTRTQNNLYLTRSKLNAWNKSNPISVFLKKIK